MSVQSRERTFRVVDELEDDVAPRKNAAGHASWHEAAAGGSTRVVVGRSGPSAAQLPLARTPETQGHLRLGLKVTHQSPEKKQEPPRNHRVGLISFDKGTLRADSMTVGAATIRAARCS